MMGMEQRATVARQQVVNPVNLPNALTVLRIILVPVFLYLLFQESTTARWWAVAVFVLAGLSDHLDGEIARRWDVITDFGKIADPIADKALTLGAFTALSVLDSHMMPWWATLVIAVRELGITWWRGVLLKKGIVVAANWGGKIKTVLQLLLIFLMILPWHSMISGGVPIGLYAFILLVFWLTIGMTVGSGVEYVWSGWKQAHQGQ